MKYIDEYRDGEAVRKYAKAIEELVTRSWTLMEICGGQTHTIMKYGLDRMLPDAVTLVHGPGCPVCVTPVELINKAVAIAARSKVIFCSFGDMLRVPGTEKDLLLVKAEGGDVRVVYSPLDAVKLAQQNSEREVVFFAVGFETTAPANAMAVWQAAQMNLPNFSILSAHVLVPPAIEAILGAPENTVQGFLAPGHVCSVMGYWEYEPIAARYHAPLVVTGFEPLDIMQGLYMTLRALEEKRYEVENQYARSVRRMGNAPAQKIMREVFAVSDRAWRGIGVIPQSGLSLSEKYRGFDAARRFDVAKLKAAEAAECIAGLIMQGRRKPPDCPAFGSRCTPDHPLGAPMVSSEGACAAYYQYTVDSRW